MSGIARALIVTGGVLVALGLLLLAAGRLPLRPGRLPGDIVIRGKNSLFYFPLGACLLLSLLLTAVLWLFRKP